MKDFDFTLTFKDRLPYKQGDRVNSPVTDDNLVTYAFPGRAFVDCAEYDREGREVTYYIKQFLPIDLDGPIP